MIKKKEKIEETGGKKIMTRYALGVTKKTKTKNLRLGFVT